MSTKRNALGRGLSALLENNETDITTREAGDVPAHAGHIALLPVEKIEANPFQPRSHFEEKALAELAQSIKELGIIQPITVRKLGYDRYQLISGERRFKASSIAGLTHIPAYVRIANDQSMLEMALVENIQRENLNPLEIALSYKRLLEECGLTQEALSQRIGKDRTTIANYMRLLKLPAEIQAGIRDTLITMGHARAIINVGDADAQLRIYHDVLNNELSVRRVEEMVRTTSAPKRKKGKMPALEGIKQIETTLSGLLETKVKIARNASGKGKIQIHFSSDEDLARIADLLDF